MSKIADLVSVTSTGFQYPDYAAVLASLKDEYKAIYGDDVYLEEDSQDGQWIAVQALAIFDTLQVAADVYNSFSPLTARTDALSRNVKINGIARLVPTNSQVDVLIEGDAGTIITNGLVEDTNGRIWALPESVTIPVEGEITRTVTAVDVGAITAQANTLTKIKTPTRGWTSVTNPGATLAALVGEPTETDAELRARQAESTMIPSLSVMDGIVGAVASVSGVLRHRGYENDTGSTDSDGVPEHSIALVVEGGDDQAIGNAIARKKTPGTGTFGTSSVDTVDQHGVTSTINFLRPTYVTISVEVVYTPKAGFLSTTVYEIAKSVAAYINSLAIGDDIFTNRIYTPANLGNSGIGATYVIDSIQISKTGPGGLDVANLALDFDEIAACDPGTADVPADVVVIES